MGPLSGDVLAADWVYTPCDRRRSITPEHQRTRSKYMNREQSIFILIGVLVLAGMLLCVPVTVRMLSLYVYAGDPNAGWNEIVVHSFMPEGWPKYMNHGLLFWQCMFLVEIISCLVLVFERSIRNNASDIEKSKRILPFTLATASLLIFSLWILSSATNCLWWLFFRLGLISAALLAFLAAIVMIDVFVVRKQAILLKTALTSLVGLTVCMAISCTGHRYSPNQIRITPNLWRLLGVCVFLCVWILYGIHQFVQKNRACPEP